MDVAEVGREQRQLRLDVGALGVPIEHVRTAKVCRRSWIRGLQVAERGPSPAFRTIRENLSWTLL